MTRPRLVVVAPVLPSASAPHAGGVILHHRVAAYTTQYDVAILAPDTPDNRATLEAGDLAAPVRLLATDPRRGGWVSLRRLGPGLAGALDVFADTVHRTLARPGADLAALLAGCDVVEVHWGEYAPLLPQLRRLAPRAALGLYLHDVLASVRAARARNPAVRWQERAVYRASAPWSVRRERALVAQADVVFVLKDDDRPLVTGRGRDGARPAVVVARPWVDLPADPGGPSADLVALFVSALWREENAEAARGLVTEVWPLVRAAEPTAVLRLVGPGAPAALAELAAAAPGVELLGFVADLAAEHARARVALAPLRDPSGLKIKVVQAMGYGLPVVASPAAAAGLRDVPPDAWGGVVEGPLATAAATLALLASFEQAQAVGARAATWVRAEFSGDVDLARAVAAYHAVSATRR